MTCFLSMYSCITQLDRMAFVVAVSMKLMAAKLSVMATISLIPSLLAVLVLSSSRYASFPGSMEEAAFVTAFAVFEGVASPNNYVAASTFLTLFDITEPSVAATIITFSSFCCVPSSSFTRVIVGMSSGISVA